MSTPLLFGPDGSPLQGSRLVNASRQTNVRPNIQIPGEQTFRKLVTQQDQRTLYHISTLLYANYGILRGAIHQKAMFSIGNSWHPVFGGEAKDWGDIAIKWLLEQWYPFHDVIGPCRDFRNGLYLDSLEIDRGGGAFVLLTETADGWPVVQRIRPSQIGQRTQSYNMDARVEKGAYAGLRIRYGVIINGIGTPVAYRVLGDTPDEDQDISAANLIYTYEPEYCDQLIGLPLASFCMEDIQDAITSAAWERICMMISSAQTLVENNDLGAANPRDPMNMLRENGVQAADSTTPNVAIETFMGGIIRYFKSNSGGKLEQFQNHRPGAEWEAHQDRHVRNMLVGIGWPYSWAWKGDGDSGTKTRADQNMAQTTVSDRQALLKYPANRMVGYAISKAINRGILPPYPGDDLGGFLKWDFTLPPLASIDPGRDGQNRREDRKFGHTTLLQVAAEGGKHWQKDLRVQQQIEVEDLLDRSLDTAKRKGVPFETVLVLMEQTNANAMAPGGNTAAPVKEEPKDEEE